MNNLAATSSRDIATMRFSTGASRCVLCLNRREIEYTPKESHGDCESP